MALKSILNYKDDLLKMPRHLEWENIKIGEVYHLPPIISLSRKDVCVTKKDDNDKTIFYKTIGDSTKTESKFAFSSILAKFIIDKHSF